MGNMSDSRNSGGVGGGVGDVEEIMPERVGSIPLSPHKKTHALHWLLGPKVGKRGHLASKCMMRSEYHAQEFVAWWNSMRDQGGDVTGEGEVVYLENATEEGLLRFNMRAKAFGMGVDVEIARSVRTRRENAGVEREGGEL